MSSMYSVEIKMENIPKISIIVPVFNVEQYLSKCLDSLINQTLYEIEIICVDDCSTDGSLKILQNYAKRDSRVCVFHLKQNFGTSYARKVGVSSARGSYIMFCDADDAFVSEACEYVCKEMERDPVDILQFETDIIFWGTHSLQEKKGLSDVLKPYYKHYSGDLCAACFKEQKWKFTLWNKAYNADICKKAYAEIEDTYIIVSEDLYAFFFISFYSTTYRGIHDKLYIYNFGIGITNSSRLDFTQFEKHVTKLKVSEALTEFSCKKGLDKKHIELIRAIKNNIITDLLYQWYNYLSLSDSKLGYDLLLKKLGASTVVSELAKVHWNDSPQLLDRLVTRERNILPGKRVKCIGIYYHRMRNGGVEKVLSKLLFVWKNMGYDLILFTDEKATDDDYPIPTDITRIVLPKFSEYQAAKYKKRARYWEAMIKKYDIDTILYHSCTSITLLWDTCLIKGLGCNLVVETHSMFCGSMWYDARFSSYLPRIYRMVDRVVALSEIDVSFWNNYAPTYYIPNPLDAISETEISDCTSKNIVWVGRLAEEKRPYDILEAFSIVIKSVPNATLTMIGDGDTPEWMEGLQNYAVQHRIDQAVRFCGYELEPGVYYKNASILAMTSLCESFSMVLAEGKGHGLPTIMYELPNLELTRDKKGIISVPQGDVLALANGMILLLKDENLRQTMGREARDSLKEFLTFDVKSAWKKLFDSFIDSPKYRPDENSVLMLDMLFENVIRGIDKIQSCSKNHTCTNINPQYEEVLNRHEEVVNRHEEVVNRHEEVVNRHEEVLNRHEKSINHQWEVQKWHEERIQKLENNTSWIKKIIKKVFN